MKNKKRESYPNENLRDFFKNKLGYLLTKDYVVSLRKDEATEQDIKKYKQQRRV